ncbi:MAG: M56 family metallopeptidase [Maricaulaceae bacterium]
MIVYQILNVLAALGLSLTLGALNAPLFSTLAHGVCRTLRSAAIRARVWSWAAAAPIFAVCASAVIALATPAFSLQAFSDARPPKPSLSTPQIVSVDARPLLAPSAESDGEPASPSAQTPHPQTGSQVLDGLRRLGAIAFVVWAAGFAIRVRWRLRETRRVEAILQDARPASLGAHAATRFWADRFRVDASVLITSQPISPCLVVRNGRARILIPKALSDITRSETLILAIAHELAHLRRGDHNAARLQAAASDVFWFSPWFQNLLVNWESAREEATVALVLNAAPDRRTDYARLWLTALRLNAGPQPAFGPHHRYLRERRLTAMLTPTPKPRPRSIAALLTGLALTTAIAPLAMAQGALAAWPALAAPVPAQAAAAAEGAPAVNAEPDVKIPPTDALDELARYYSEALENQRDQFARIGVSRSNEDVVRLEQSAKTVTVAETDAERWAALQAGFAVMGDIQDRLKFVNEFNDADLERLLDDLTATEAALDAVNRDLIPYYKEMERRRGIVAKRREARRALESTAVEHPSVAQARTAFRDHAAGMRDRDWQTTKADWDKFHALHKVYESARDATSPEAEQLAQDVTDAYARVRELYEQAEPLFDRRSALTREVHELNAEIYARREALRATAQ